MLLVLSVLDVLDMSRSLSVGVNANFEKCEISFFRKIAFFCSFLADFSADFSSELPHNNSNDVDVFGAVLPLPLTPKYDPFVSLHG